MLKPQVWAKRPRFEHIKNEKLSMKMNFFQQKDCAIHNQRPFFVKKNVNSQKVANPFNNTNLFCKNCFAECCWWCHCCLTDDKLDQPINPQNVTQQKNNIHPEMVQR